MSFSPYHTNGNINEYASIFPGSTNLSINKLSDVSRRDKIKHGYVLVYDAFQKRWRGSPFGNSTSYVNLYENQTITGSKKFTLPIRSADGIKISDKIHLQAPTSSISHTLLLPGDNGVGVLRNDGTGNLAWATDLVLSPDNITLDLNGMDGKLQSIKWSKQLTIKELTSNDYGLTVANGTNLDGSADVTVELSLPQSLKTTADPTFAALNFPLLRLEQATSGAVQHTLFLPGNNGVGVLRNDGTGNLAWATDLVLRPDYITLDLNGSGGTLQAIRWPNTLTIQETNNYGLAVSGGTSIDGTSNTTVQLSLPQNLKTTADPTFAALNLPYVRIQSASSGAVQHTLSLPNNNAAGVLENNGSGSLSWGTSYIVSPDLLTLNLNGTSGKLQAIKWPNTLTIRQHPSLNFGLVVLNGANIDGSADQTIDIGLPQNLQATAEPTFGAINLPNVKIAPSSSGTTAHTLRLPGNNASGSLTNDGSGNLSWVESSGGFSQLHSSAEPKTNWGIAYLYDGQWPPNYSKNTFNNPIEIDTISMYINAGGSAYMGINKSHFTFVANADISYISFKYRDADNTNYGYNINRDGAISSISDRNLKTNLIPYHPTLDNIYRMQIYHFDFIQLLEQHNELRATIENESKLSTAERQAKHTDQFKRERKESQTFEDWLRVYDEEQQAMLNRLNGKEKGFSFIAQDIEKIYPGAVHQDSVTKHKFLDHRITQTVINQLTIDSLRAVNRKLKFMEVTEIASTEDMSVLFDTWRENQLTRCVVNGQTFHLKNNALTRYQFAEQIPLAEPFTYYPDDIKEKEAILVPEALVKFHRKLVQLANRLRKFVETTKRRFITTHQDKPIDVINAKFKATKTLMANEFKNKYTQIVVS